MSWSKNIGIIGGGQLGLMMAMSAVAMGHRVFVLDPVPGCPASRCAKQIVADYDDEQALKQLAKKCDVLSYEFENVSADGLDKLSPSILPQGTKMLRISQNRILEKEFLSKIGVKVAPYFVINSPSELDLIKLDKPYILKTATGGYDGQGQVLIKNGADLSKAKELANSRACVLEELLSFEKEISIIIAGNGFKYTLLPPQENTHKNGILYKSIAPARISLELKAKANAIAKKIAASLKLRGVMCVEMFVVKGELLVNEIAPRPHNSGHYSIQACNFSQFDLHILGILGAKLPRIRLLSPALMFNILGQDLDAMLKLAKQNPNWHACLYGKSGVKPNRKMGHITILSKDLDFDLEDKLSKE